MVALIKLVGERLPVTQILLIRQIGMVIMLAPALLTHFPDVLKTRRLPLQLVRIVLALIAMLGGFTAIINMPLADAIALGFAKSFFITIFAVWILKETVGAYRWSAVAFGFLGVLIMLKPGPEGLSLYGLLAVMGAAAAGGVMVVIRLLSRTDSSNTILAFQALGVGVVMVIPALLQWVAPNPKEWALLVVIGVVSYYAQKANILAFTYGEASLLASLDYVRLIYATLFGWILFHELPSISTWIGAGIIVLAALFTVHRESKRHQRLARGPGGRSLNNS